MISYKTHKSIIKTIRNSDQDFLIKDGFTMVPRAGFEISSGCPYSYRSIIQECINNGWLNPVAHIRNYEYTYDKLCEK
jgi:hypothetical protein